MPDRGSPFGTGPGLVDRLIAARLRVGITFAIFLGLNFLLLAAYLWSHGGQTTHVRVQARGNAFAAYIDGKLHVEGRFDAPTQGGIIVTLAETESIPSLPRPRGIDSVRVRDFKTGRVLFEDDFDSGPRPEWKEVAGDFKDYGGVLGAYSESYLVLTDQPWRDYIVEVTFKNLNAAAVTVRAKEGGAGVSYGFRPFRHYDNGFLATAEDGTQANGPAAPLELDRTETVKAMVAMALGPYPRTLLLLALGFIAVFGLQFVGAFRIPFRLGTITRDVAWFGAWGLAAFGFVVTLFLNYSYNSHMPHVPDEVAYLFQAKVFASGRLSSPLPPVKDVFDFFYPPFIIESGDRWISVYPFGHPLVLAFGWLVRAVWLVPPLLGAGTVLLVFAIGRKVYNDRVGLLAALLMVTSPFYLMTASNFMSHNTAAFYMLVSLLFIVLRERRPLLYGVLGGLFFGLLFNTQPLTAVGLIPPFGAYLLSQLLPRERRKQELQHIAGFAAGGLVMLLAYFVYNYGTTGDAFASAFYTGTNAEQNIGFDGHHSASIGIQNQHIQLAFLLLVLNGWPLYIGLMFVLLPFVLGTRHRWDWFLLVSIVFALAVYVLFIGHGIMHGPRYWYVASPLLMLLAARGADYTADRLSDAAGAVRNRFTGATVQPRWAAVLLVYALVAALAGSSLYSWLLGRNVSWSDEFVPARASELRGFNRADDRLITLVDRARLHNALVLVEGDCYGWQCYGSVFWKNSPTLDGDVVYAKDYANRLAELLQAYPDRFVYHTRYAEPAALTPYGRAGPAIRRPVGENPPNVPRARDIPVPTPVPTPTPDPNEAVRRDDQRRQGVETIAEALREYYRRHGSYPLAEGLQSFCRFPELDAGCRLSEVMDPVPQDPQHDKTYYYFSDGRTFAVYAVMEEAVEPTNCPQDPAIRPTVEAGHLYCVVGSLGQ